MVERSQVIRPSAVVASTGSVVTAAALRQSPQCVLQFSTVEQVHEAGRIRVLLDLGSIVA